MVPLSHSYTASLLTSVNYASFLKCEQVSGGALVCWLMWQFVILCAKFLSHVKILVIWLKKKEIWNTFSVCWVRQIVCKVHLSPSMHFLNPEFEWKHPQETQGRARETLGCFSLWTSCRAQLNACLWLGTKICAKNIFVPNQRLASSVTLLSWSSYTTELTCKLNCLLLLLLL